MAYLYVPPAPLLKLLGFDQKTVIEENEYPRTTFESNSSTEYTGYCEES